jgi:hypothetical protein
MLLALAVMETVGREAAAPWANAEIASQVRRGARDEIVFKGACLSIDLYGLVCEISVGVARPIPYFDAG